MAYAVQLEGFEGPLDLLLQLVEAEKLEITEISLMRVTEPFLRRLEEQRDQIPLEELADFLVIAAKLVYLKSRALLPTLEDPLLEEGPDLATQLRAYKAFVEAANRIGEMTRQGMRAFGRLRRSVVQEEKTEFVPPTGVTSQGLHEMYARVIRRLEPITVLPRAAVARVVTIEEKIAELTERVRQGLQLSFHRLLAESGSRDELVVSFLALLELMKQRIISVRQAELFEDIYVS